MLPTKWLLLIDLRTTSASSQNHKKPEREVYTYIYIYIFPWDVRASRPNALKSRPGRTTPPLHHVAKRTSTGPVPPMNTTNVIISNLNWGQKRYIIKPSWWTDVTYCKWGLFLRSLLRCEKGGEDQARMLRGPTVPPLRAVEAPCFWMFLVFHVVGTWPQFVRVPGNIL